MQAPRFDITYRKRTKIPDVYGKKVLMQNKRTKTNNQPRTKARAPRAGEFSIISLAVKNCAKIIIYPFIADICVLKMSVGILFRDYIYMKDMEKFGQTY